MPRKGQGRVTGRPVTTPIPSPAGGVKLETFIPWTLVKRGAKKQVITPIEAPEEFRVEAVTELRERETAKHSTLVRALGLAHYWQRLLDEGKATSFAGIAEAEGLDKAHISRLCRLTCLAPDITELCLSGEQGGLTLDRLMRQGIPKEWDKQRDALSSLYLLWSQSPLRGGGGID